MHKDEKGKFEGDVLRCFLKCINNRTRQLLFRAGFFLMEGEMKRFKDVFIITCLKRSENYTCFFIKVVVVKKNQMVVPDEESKGSLSDDSDFVVQENPDKDIKKALSLVVLHNYKKYKN